MEHQQTAGHHEEHPPTTIRQYILIGLILAVITVAELYLTEGMDLEFGTLVGLLIFLSAIKFAIVVALFMHLRFDNKLFTRLFVFGLLLAGAIMISLLALFHGDDSSRHGVAGVPGAIVPAVFEPAGHGDEEEHEDEEGAEPGAELVAGLAPADFFAANCAACHGANREGLVGPALTPTTLTQADEFYHDTIKNGRQGTAMPPWGGMLNDTDIDVLVHFLKTVEP
jgi:cytochrome c oxidase subunit IV